MKNPFTLTFGKVPNEYIARVSQIDEIMNSFVDDVPDSQAYIISGVRGSGKTVLLTDISARLKKMDDWIVINLMPQEDMMRKAVADLYSEENIKMLFVKAKIDLSVLGVGVSITNEFEYSDIQTVLLKMIEIVKKAGKKILFSIDEVENTRFMRTFCSNFQLYVRSELPVFMLMTGLEHNISNLSHSEGHTFLLRIPRIEMKSLNITSVAASYQRILSVSTEQSWSMAVLTKGYSFAFQTLGTLAWNRKEDIANGEFTTFLDALMPEYDQRLQDYVYAKLWEECSPIEKKILMSFGENTVRRVCEIREELDNMNSNNFNVHRDRLTKKGLLISPEKGKVELALPRFNEYIKYYGFLT